MDMKDIQGKRIFFIFFFLMRKCEAYYSHWRVIYILWSPYFTVSVVSDPGIDFGRVCGEEN